jgi:hypothetical protein
VKFPLKSCGWFRDRKQIKAPAMRGPGLFDVLIG